MNPLVSVIMSNYNGELYLHDAIKSILVQTYSNFEFLIFDDGSHDQSCEIFKEYTHDKRITVFCEKQNKGLPTALNFLLSKAKGKYIVRMDSDDISLPQRIDEQVAFMEKNPKIDVSGTSCKIIGTHKIEYYPLSDNAIKAKLFYISGFAHPSVIIRKSSLPKGGYPIYEHSEDLAMWNLMAENGATFHNQRQPLILYRKHLNSMTAKSHLPKQLRATRSILHKKLSALMGAQYSENSLNLHFELICRTKKAYIKSLFWSIHLLKYKRDPWFIFNVFRYYAAYVVYITKN